jgi:hypothetical protein
MNSPRFQHNRIATWKKSYYAWKKKKKKKTFRWFMYQLVQSFWRQLISAPSKFNHCSSVFSFFTGSMHLAIINVFVRKLHNCESIILWRLGGIHLLCGHTLQTRFNLWVIWPCILVTKIKNHFGRWPSLRGPAVGEASALETPNVGKNREPSRAPQTEIYSSALWYRLNSSGL